MDSKSKFSEIVTIFERVRPEIEQGIANMQPTEQQKIRQMWLELVEMADTKDTDIRAFLDKLSKFNKRVYEYRNRSQVLASAADINVI